MKDNEKAHNMAIINYRLLAKIREVKDRPYLPSGVQIDYDLLGKVLEKKKENGTIL